MAALPKRVAVIEQKLAGAKAHLEKVRVAAKSDEANRKKFEANIKDLQGKISKYRDQSLDVKTNDQYKALLHEIQFAEQEIRLNEDRILEVMVNVDAREKEVQAAEAELKAETAEIEKEKEEARKVTAEDQKKLSEWNAKRDALRRAISEDILRQYERVAKFRGSGLAEVRDHKCMGCQVMLRPQTYNEVRNGEKVMVCESCSRVYYFNPANEVKPEQEVVTVTGRKRARPKADAPQAWFYRPDYPEEGEVLLVFINNGGNSARRIYEMHTGRQVGAVLVREANYRLAFPDDSPTPPSGSTAIGKNKRSTSGAPRYPPMRSIFFTKTCWPSSASTKRVTSIPPLRRNNRPPGKPPLDRQSQGNLSY